MNYLIGSVVALALVFATNLASYVGELKNKEAYGAVAIGNEYQATTTDSTWSGATGQCKAGGLTDNKTLGSVVIPFTSNADIAIYDATSTVHSDHPTTTLAIFPSTAAGTYTFDVRAKRGICVLVTNAAGEGIASSTITSRP